MDPFDDPDDDDFDDWGKFDPYPDWKPYRITTIAENRNGQWLSNTSIKW